MSARSMRATVYLQSIGRLLPGDHIHFETSKVEPTSAKLEAIEVAQLKRMRKLQKARAAK